MEYARQKLKMVKTLGCKLKIFKTNRQKKKIYFEKLKIFYPRTVGQMFRKDKITGAKNKNIRFLKKNKMFKMTIFTHRNLFFPLGNKDT